MTAKKAMIVYTGDGPDGAPPGNDKPKLIKAVFTPGGAFDPDTTHNVRAKLTDTSDGSTMFSVNLAAGAPWSQPNPAKLLWKYKDLAVPTATGIKTALLKEVPPASGSFQFKMIGKDAGISDATLGAGGDIAVTLEIESGGVGVCHAVTLTDCLSTAAKDLCKP
jgi:hypothetical protein